LALYYGSFAPGLQTLIAAVVRERLSDVIIHKLLEGALLFETSLSYDRLNFFCFNNIFAVISVREAREAGDPQSALEAHIRSAFGGIIPADESVLALNNRKIRSFRLIASLENRLVSLDNGLLARAEGYIAMRSGMRPHRSRPDTEFWFLYRSEGFSVFMKRLSRHASWEKSLHSGELPPPLAWTLCWLSRPCFGETVADPFCGYGSIPAARLKYFPKAMVHASDTNETVLAYTRKKLAGLGSGGESRIERANAFSLAERFPGGLDAVITDPPWGLYEPPGPAKAARRGRPGAAQRELPVKVKLISGSLERFYADMAVVFAAALKSGGRAVVLTACGKELLAGVERAGSLAVEADLPVLVSGKKARIIVLEKPPTPLLPPPPLGRSWRSC
jgi:tRNA G10  N-methylase Trm11